MVPRGEVGIVVANLALLTGVVDASLFAAILVAVVLTTVVAPYLLAYSVPRAEAEAARTERLPGRPAT
jgi:Kef-type K+ transport system membrane component KefB